jgi:hypothetical protein
MSWEGFEVLVCEEGHMWKNPAYATEDSDLCGICGKPAKDIGSVDETNGLPYYLTFKVICLDPAKYEHCPTCFHMHIITPPKYKMIKCKMYESHDGNFVFPDTP